MPKRISISPLFNFPRCIVEDVKISPGVAWIMIRYDLRYSFYCPVCKGVMWVNRRVNQVAKDLPLGEVEMVMIRYEAVQCYCPRCRFYHTFTPEGIDINARATNRLMY